MKISVQNDQLLSHAGRNKMSASRRGKLTIFFGYAPGVGKTCAMLLAAHAAKTHGTDVVVGFLQTHSRPYTEKLAKQLEHMPLWHAPFDGKMLQELNIDDVLKRKPQLVLVDDLAHQNAGNCRHAKRYQGIEELLRAGIDVYTTLNVQQLEGLTDAIASIVGPVARERIPDFVFDNADNVQLVDIEPSELLLRLSQGEVSREDQSEFSETAFFSLERLSVLRKLALQRCADRVSLITSGTGTNDEFLYHTDEHIMVCLSTSPSNAKIIRTAAKMAIAFRGTFTALYVKVSGKHISEESSKCLKENMRLAQQMGASIETVDGSDVPFQITEFVRLSGVTKIVMGHSSTYGKLFCTKPPMANRLMAIAPNLDIYVIPDLGYRNFRPDKEQPQPLTLSDLTKTLLIIALITLTGVAFASLGFTEANIITIYVLGVLIISVVTNNRIYGLLASVVSVFSFNFFFTLPRFGFRFYDSSYLVTFFVMFWVSFLTGSLATKLKDNARQSAESAYKTRLLLETNQLLQKMQSEQQIIYAVANQLVKLINRDIVIRLESKGVLGEPQIFLTPQSSGDDILQEDEQAVAEWVFKNGERAGATTDTLSTAKCMYLSVSASRHSYGVLGILMGDRPFLAFENSILVSILGECSMALENIKNANEKEAAAILAKNEQLRANLLRTISHDLRTPLTSISGNAGNLLTDFNKLDDNTRTQIFTDIYNDSIWLINLVENILAITKIEDGKVLHKSVELVDEVISEALLHINRRSSEHDIKVNVGQELILAEIDTKLIVQVLVNLVDNAIKYTPAGSPIEINAQKYDNMVKISVADNGPGIDDSHKEHIFEMFYTGANKIADSRRSLGLGLSLCKSIVTAHGGIIEVLDNRPCGAIFTFTLPIGEVTLHE